MWQSQRIELWLREPLAVTVVCGHFILCVSVVAIRTRPVIESQELLCLLISDVVLAFLLAIVLVLLVGCFAFLFLLVANVLLQGLVKFIDPFLHAAQVEGRITLLAVPDVGSLVNPILANNALLVTSCQRLDVEDTLLSQVLKLGDKVLVVVLDLGLITILALLLLVIGHFFLGSVLMLILDVVSTRAQIFG
jgi:hypothetical protein